MLTVSTFILLHEKNNLASQFFVIISYYRFTYEIHKRLYVHPIEILDLECVLCHVTGVQNENKNALINLPSWIFPRSVVYKMSWGEFNLPL